MMLFDKFTQIEYKNWQSGVNAYDLGFGALTQQTLPTLLSKAGFPPSTLLPTGATTTQQQGHSNNDDAKTYEFLDVATGPGYALSAALENSLDTTTNNLSFTGLDFSPNFLEMAKKRIIGSNDEKMKMVVNNSNNNIEFVEGSATDMPFPDDTFDAIVCNFGILHFSEPDLFLREAYRCLKPGGRCSFTVWTKPPKTEGFNIIHKAVSLVGNPKVPLPEGPNFFHYADPDTSRCSLEQIGFVDIDVTEIDTMEWDCIQNGEMLYKTVLEGTARTRELLIGQTKEQSEAIQKKVAQLYNEMTNDGTRSLKMPAVVTSGLKPLLPR